MRTPSDRSSPQAQSISIAAVGSDIRALASACNQLANDIDSREIDADDVSRYFGGTVDVTGFQIADAVMNREGAQALRLPSDWRRERTVRGSDPPPLLRSPILFASQVAVATAPPGMSRP